MEKRQKWESVEGGERKRRCGTWPEEAEEVLVLMYSSNNSSGTCHKPRCRLLRGETGRRGREKSGGGAKSVFRGRPQTCRSFHSSWAGWVTFRWLRRSALPFLEPPACCVTPKRPSTAFRVSLKKNVLPLQSSSVAKG